MKETTNNPASNEETFPVKETFKIEFLLARSDKTWDTKTFDVPLSLEEAPDKEIEYWWLETFMWEHQYSDIVAVVVYNILDDD